MTRWYNELLRDDAMTEGLDPHSSEPVLDREAWMADARRRRQGLIKYWLERGREDYGEQLGRLTGTDR